ncbi:hypothetical protein NUW58_g4169 [Xylaria curta]|uniref:Uncharacterized protein n=1 Tax=Xylaria curta TaxID=42375 RepID=A0ACC1P8W0_9PEZI|nr:hypothetical protein NUW58_g4169 [Xylaria curta]
MADSRAHSSGSRSRTVRSQKIAESDASTRSEASDRNLPLRSHTPGHLSSKSQSSSGGGPPPSSSRRKASEPSIRQRSQYRHRQNRLPPLPPPSRCRPCLPSTAPSAGGA